MKLPTELFGMILLISIFVMGYWGFMGGLADSYGVAVDDMAWLNKTEEVYDFSEDYYEQLESSMTENPTSPETSIYSQVATFLSTSASTIAYMFIEMPMTLGGVIMDSVVNFPFMPPWVGTAFAVFIILALLGWVIYFASGKKA